MVLWDPEVFVNSEVEERAEGELLLDEEEEEMEVPEQSVRFFFKSEDLSIPSFQKHGCFRAASETRHSKTRPFHYQSLRQTKREQGVSPLPS